MFSCAKCGNYFRDKRDLCRHQSRLRPCVKVSPQGYVNLPCQNTTLPCSNPIIKEQKKTCQFCLHTFYDKRNKNKHENICKHRNDTRVLEIELNINPNLPEDKMKCRFCNKNMSRADVLNKHKCKERDFYHQELLKQKQQIEYRQLTINNGIINNTTNNNLNIHFHENTVPFGSKRLTDHINIDRFVDILRDSYKQYQPGQSYEVAGEILLRLEECLQERPENRNYLPDQKSTIWTVKTDSGVKVIDKDKCLNTIIKENAGIIYNKRTDIDIHNQQVFKNKTMIDAFDHQESFKKKGIDYTIHGDRKLNKIKSGLMMVNKNVCDF